MNTLSLKRKKILYSYILSSPILFTIGLFFSTLYHTPFPFMLAFSFLYLFTILYSIKKFGLMSLYTIYTFTSAFFMYDCIFMTLMFSDKNFLVQTFPVKYTFSIDIGMKFLICCFIAVFSSHVSYCFFFKKDNKGLQIRTLIKGSKSIKKIAVFLCILFAFPLAYKIYLQLSFVRSHGFSAVYTSGFTNIKYPFWCSGAFLLFNSAYYIFLATKPSKKEFLFVTSIYIFMYVFNSLKGGRGGIIALFVVTFYLLVKEYKITVNIKKVICFFIFIIFFIMGITSIRQSYEVNTVQNKTSVSVGKVIKELLWDQTTSRAVPMLIMRGNLKYHPYPFLFTPITERFITIFHKYKAASIESIENLNDPSIVLIANVQMYGALTGRGYGSALLGEAYECYGIIGIVFFYVLVSFIISVLEARCLNFRGIFIPFFYVLLTTIPIIPRKEILQLLKYNLNSLVVCYILFFAILVFVRYGGKSIK